MAKVTLLSGTFPTDFMVKVMGTGVPGVLLKIIGLLVRVMPCTSGMAKDSVSLAVTDGLVVLSTVIPKDIGVPAGGKLSPVGFK